MHHATASHSAAMAWNQPALAGKPTALCFALQIHRNPAYVFTCVHMCIYTPTKSDILHCMHTLYEKMQELSLAPPPFLQVVTQEYICVDCSIFLSLFKLGIF